MTAGEERQTAVGRWLYRWRAWLGMLGYLVALAASDFSVTALVFGLPLVVLGLTLRFWAAGYIGAHSRGREIQVIERVQRGPYRWTAHPLYLGNGLLVAGVLVALAPPWWLRLTIVVFFVIEYSLIAQAENKALQAPVLSQQPEVEAWRMRRAVGEWQTVATTTATLLLAAFVAWLKARPPAPA
ncbi:MAG: methyltransferase [candidate division WOR-3 bacterium]